MPTRTSIFRQLPWIGGVNSSLDPAMIPANQLVQADNVIFDTRGSRRKREGVKMNWDDATTGSVSLIGLVDFWFGVNGKTQSLVSLGDNKTFYKYNSSGNRTTLSLDASATAWGSSITRCSFVTMNNLLITAVDGTSNVMRKWSGSGNIFDLGGTPPEASIVSEHQGRVWANDKTNLDRLHYCTTGNPEEWNGVGDSGALDIGVGDGDPEGITAIFPTFKGVLFVAKKTKLYKISGFSPEDYQVELVSSGIGCVSHNAICTIDQDDIYFISEKGIHSLSATNTYGDFESTFISSDIQKTFNDNWDKSRLKFAQAIYVSNLNSAVFAVTDSTISSSENRALWFYNIGLKSWYRWPDQSCQSIALVKDSDKMRMYMGTSVSRVTKSQNGLNYDISTSGVNTAIIFQVKTGIIYPDQSPYETKGFKKFGLIYNPKGPHTITATITIDNFSPQVLTFSELGSLDLLDSTFILDSSVLDYTVVMAPYTQPIDGYGRGFGLLLEQSGTSEEVEIQGFLVEYEQLSSQQETRLGDSL